MLKSRFFLRQFLSFFLIIITVFVIISSLIITITRLSLQDQQLIIAENYRIQSSQTMKRWLQGRQNFIRGQALHLQELHHYDLRTEAVGEMLKKQVEQNDYFIDIVVINDEGRPINSIAGPTDSNADLSGRQYFINAMNGKSSVTGFLPSSRSGRPVMVIAEPIIIDKEPKYVMIGVIPFERVWQIVTSLELGEMGHVYLVDQEGMFITNSDYIQEYIDNGNVNNEEQYQLDTYAVNKVVLKQSGTSTYRDFANRRVLGSFEWLDAIGVGLIVEFQDSKVMAPIYELIEVLAIVAIFVIVLGSILAFILSRNIVNPVRKLIDASSSITTHNYQEPLKIKTGTELDILIDSFNDMQIAIQTREELLQKKNREIDIQRAQALEANRLKSQFLANMSHELRTPLNSIIGFTSRVIKKCGYVLPEVHLQNLEIVKEEGLHLLDLINDILDLSKIEAGKMEVNTSEFDLREVVNDLKDIVEVLISEKALSFNVSMDEGKHLITSDRTKIKQILLNLLSNAVKYSESGKISLNINKERDCYKIDVTDEGIGIAQEDYHKIFDEFRQVDGSNTRTVGGTGLGLTITKKFVNLLKGDISVDSTVGKGSKFTVTLPQNYLSTIGFENEHQKNHVYEKTILCIEDDVYAQNLYKQYFDEINYKIVFSSDGRNILELVETVQPDIILLDIILPHVDGWDILSALKFSDISKDIPVIMISMLSENTLAYKIGAYGYLVKPVKQNELIAAVKKATNHEDIKIYEVDSIQVEGGDEGE